jgi:hypothetical protein
MTGSRKLDTVSGLFYILGMPFEEKRAWILGLLAVGTYAGYVTVILGRAESTPLTEVPYASTLLWTVGISIAASIVLHILVAIVSPKDADKKDLRDKEIHRFGEYVGQSFLVAGGVAVLAMAMAELDYFWIANVIYLAFVLSAILGSAAKIVAYRRGFQGW